MKYMTDRERTGKIILTTFLGLCLLSDVIIAALSIFKFGPFALFKGIVRLSLTGGLFYAVYAGHKWARWLTVTLYSIACIMTAMVLIRTPHLLFVILLILFGGVLCMLTFIPQTVEFLKHQNKRLTEQTPNQASEATSKPAAGSETPQG
jgi:hypothetical protein